MTETRAEVPKDVRARLAEAAGELHDAMHELALGYGHFVWALVDAMHERYMQDGETGVRSLQVAVSTEYLHLEMARTLARFGLVSFLKDPQIQTVEQSPLTGETFFEFRDELIRRVDAGLTRRPTDGTQQ